MQKISEKEALDMLKAKLTCMKLEALSCVEKGCDRDCESCEYNYSQGNIGEQKEVLAMAITALEEIQQYRAIDTVEECRKALERMKPKSPTYDGDGYAPDGTFVWDEWLCPNCGSRYEVDFDEYDHCPNCGQAILREEAEAALEKMEGEEHDTGKSR